MPDQHPGPAHRTHLGCRRSFPEIQQFPQRRVARGVHDAVVIVLDRHLTPEAEVRTRGTEVERGHLLPLAERHPEGVGTGRHGVLEPVGDGDTGPSMSRDIGCGEADRVGADRRGDDLVTQRHHHRR